MSYRISARKEYALWFNDNYAVSQNNAASVVETAFNLNNQRSQAKSLIGTRAIFIAPTIRERSVTLICDNLI